MEGWIKLFRQLKKWEWYKDTVTFRVFIDLLLNANYEEKMWKGIKIKRGQVFTSYQTIINNIGDKTFTKQKIRTAVSHLISTHEITVLSTHKGLLITIEKYELYQSQKEKSTQLSTQNQHTIQHDVNTNIRSIRNKEERNIYSLSDFSEKELVDLYDN